MNHKDAPDWQPPIPFPWEDPEEFLWSPEEHSLARNAYWDGLEALDQARLPHAVAARYMALYAWSRGTSTVDSYLNRVASYISKALDQNKT